MDKVIHIKKGLDLPMGGSAERRVVDARGIERYAVKPTDVVGLSPRLVVAEGDRVKAGQPLVVHKQDDRIALTSPVNGVVEAVVRGEKRALLAVVVKRDGTPEAAANNIQLSTLDGQHLKELLIERGLWWALRERPFGAIANPDHQPKAIFVSLFDTAPVAADLQFCLAGREHELETGLQALAAIAPVHVGVKWASNMAHHNAEGVTYHVFRGPHPAGNIGTQIAAISPINKGECVYVVGAQDAAMIGHLLLTGEYRPEKVIAAAGPAAKAPHYYRLLSGASIKSIADAQMLSGNYPEIESTLADTRVISGNALSGTQIAPDGFLGMYDNMLTFLPEGNYYDFMGWLMPGLKKFSFSNTFLSGVLTNLTPKCMRPVLNKSLAGCSQFDTNVHGSVRPLMFTGGFERVCPLDIYPMQLIKACIVGDMELQEKLGIYEVEPEDLALCEFIDPSKTEIQTVIREALETLRKEATA